MAKFCIRCGKEIEGTDNECESCKDNGQIKSTNKSPIWILRIVGIVAFLLAYFLELTTRDEDKKLFKLFVKAICAFCVIFSFAIYHKKKDTLITNSLAPTRSSNQLPANENPKLPAPFYSIATAPKTSPLLLALPSALLLAGVLDFATKGSVMKLLGLPSTGPLAGLLAIIFSVFLFVPLIGKINSTTALKDNGELVNGYKKEEDVAAGIRHYIHPLEPHLPSSDGGHLFIQFIGTELSDKLTVKLWVANQYTDSEWHFVHELIFKTDNNTYTIPITPTRDFSVHVDQSSHRTTKTYWEYAAFYLQRKMFEDIAVSQNLLVSFRGKTKYQDLTFDSYVKRRGIIDAYNAYRSNPDLYQFMDELEKKVQKATPDSETVQSTDQRLFDIVLTSASSDTMTTVKLLMNLCSINLQEAMEKAKNLPSIIQENVSESNAEQIKDEFQHIGAEVEILNHT